MLFNRKALTMFFSGFRSGGSRFVSLFFIRLLGLRLLGYGGCWRGWFGLDGDGCWLRGPRADACVVTDHGCAGLLQFAEGTVGAFVDAMET